MNINGVYGEIDSFPGCSQIAVSHAVFIDPTKRGKGLGKSANKARQMKVFDSLGYDMMLCTVCKDNTAQIKILRDNGWVFLTSFKSSKTGHWVELWSCYK